MNAQKYYNFDEFQKITTNISNCFISALEAIIKITKESPELSLELFDVSNYDIEQLKRLDIDSAKEIILSNPEIFAFNITSNQLQEAKERKFTVIQNFKGSDVQHLVENFYASQTSALLELVELVKAGGKEFVNLLYQINEDALDDLVEMNPYELYQLLEKFEYGIRLNERYSLNPVVDTIALLSAIGDKAAPIKTMLIDSILNVKNIENAQPDFQDQLLNGFVPREELSFEKSIPENSALVWSAHNATSTDKFLHLYLSSNFKKVLKAKIAHDKATGESKKIFPDESIKTLGKLKSNSFSWYSSRYDQLKIYLLVSMYSRVFNRNFDRYPSLHEITILCFAFELKYKLRNTYCNAMDLSHVHRVISNIPLIYGDILEKDDPNYQDIKKLSEDPQPALIKEPCETCGMHVYIKRFKRNSTKCVWCSESLKKKNLLNVPKKENTKLKIKKIVKR